MSKAKDTGELEFICDCGHCIEIWNKDPLNQEDADDPLGYIESDLVSVRQPVTTSELKEILAAALKVESYNKKNNQGFRLLISELNKEIKQQ